MGMQWSWSSNQPYSHSRILLQSHHHLLPCKTVSQLHLQAWIKLVSSYVFHLREQNQLVWQLGAELCLKFQNSLFCSHVKKNIISPTDPCQLRSDGEESLQDTTQLLRLISPQALQIRTCTALIVFPEVLFAGLSQCLKHEFFRFYWQFSNRKSPRERECKNHSRMTGRETRYKWLLWNC